MLVARSVIMDSILFESVLEWSRRSSLPSLNGDIMPWQPYEGLLARLESIQNSMERAAESMHEQTRFLRYTAESLSQLPNPRLADLQQEYLDTINKYARDLGKTSQDYANEVRGFSRSLQRTSEQYANEIRAWSTKADREQSFRFRVAQFIAVAALIVSVSSVVITIITLSK